MAEAVATIRNGVNVDQLVQTVGLIQQQPDLARFKFRSHTGWRGGGRCATQIQSFYGAGQEDSSRTEPFILEGDEPPVLLGSNQGPNAVEAVLHALGACLAVGYAYNAAARGINVERLELDMEGDLDLHGFLGLSQEIRPGFSNIRVNARVKADADRKTLVDLCQYVQDTSPVLDIIRNPVSVKVDLATE